MGISKGNFERIEKIARGAMSGGAQDIRRAQLAVLLEIARGMVTAEPETLPNDELRGRPEWLTVRDLHSKLEGYINSGRANESVFLGVGAFRVVATAVLDCEQADGSDYICILPFTGQEEQSPIADKLKMCKKLCKSGKFETGEGVCAAICMDQLGSPRSSLHGCAHAVDVHGKLAATLMADD